MKLHSAHPLLFFFPSFLLSRNSNQALARLKTSCLFFLSVSHPSTSFFSMTEPYVLHSTPLSIHFWLTVKIFALTAQIQNTQWFFNPFGINSFKVILAEEADYKKYPHPLGIWASPCFYYCIQSSSAVEGGHPCWKQPWIAGSHISHTPQQHEGQCHSGPP